MFQDEVDGGLLSVESAQRFLLGVKRLELMASVHDKKPARGGRVEYEILGKACYTLPRKGVSRPSTYRPLFRVAVALALFQLRGPHP